MNIFTEEKYIKHLNRRVKTPFGYQTIEYVYKTKPLPVLIITLENKQIEVCTNHTFIVEGNEVPAYNLADGDYLETLTGMQKVLEIQSAGNKVLYDISLDQSEFENYWYYADGVLSHNSGKSITVACYLCWLFTFFKQKNIGIVANRAAQAREFLRNTKDIYSKLPIWMTVGMTEWNKGTIANENEMRIMTDVPSSDSFRGFSVHCIHGNSDINVKNIYNDHSETLTMKELYERLAANSTGAGT